MSEYFKLPKTWECDGRQLEPKRGDASSNAWICDGREIKPKVGAMSSNTWCWNGS